MREGGKIETKSNGEVKIMAVYVAKRLMATNMACNGGGRLVGKENKKRIDKRRMARLEESKVDSNSERGEELEGLEGS